MKHIKPFNQINESTKSESGDVTKLLPADAYDRIEKMRREREEEIFNNLKRSFKSASKLSEEEQQIAGFFTQFGVDYDEWLLKVDDLFRSEFDQNGFAGNYFNYVPDVDEYVTILKNLGATDIKMSGFSHADDYYCDTLFFKISKDGYYKAIKIDPSPSEFDFNNGVARFWWD